MLSPEKYKREKKDLEILWKIIFTTAALCAVGALVIIIGFLLVNGLPAMIEYGIIEFITGTVWSPTEGIYGIWNMLLTTIITTLGAVIIAVPLGLLTAVFISQIATGKFAEILKVFTRILASIPSVVYGFIGIIIVIPFVRGTFGGSGQSILTAIIILSIMILPTIISISEVSISAVSKTMKEASYGLGASEMQTIWHVIVPSAKSGIFSGIILGIGRALGETVAVMMVIGNSSIVESLSLTGPARTLTTNIGTEMSYASGTQREMLFATGIVLLAFIVIVNLVMNKIAKRGN